MTRVDNYSAAQNYYNSTAQTRKDSSRAGKTANAGRTGNTEPAKLSRSAQKVLDELKKKYGKMDFMVADFEGDDEAKEILSRGTKEFSVLLSTDELEKMADDESYKEKNMDKIDGAVKMSERINARFDVSDASNSAEVKNIGISFNSDGTTSYFAELEKSSEQQRERIEQSREKRAEEKKASEKKESGSKRVTIKASSEDELLEKMKQIDWSKVKEEKAETSGSKFDYSI